MIKSNRSWDVLYGRIDYDEYEYSLIQLPEVQRLRYIRMCNINSMLVTGASEISRFEHTLGVLRLTQEWLTHNGVPHQDSANLKAAAVLHDMQTGPFGHSLQYVFEDNEVEGEFLHDDIKQGKEKTYHQDLEARASFSGKPFAAQNLLGEQWKSIAAIIRGEGSLGPIIAGTMDLDNLDNVVRLAYHVGVANSDDAQIVMQIARDLKPFKNGIMISKDSISLVKRWQEVRKRLYELLLLDWAEFSAKAMLTKAMEKAIAFGSIGTQDWLQTDYDLLSKLAQNIGDSQEIAELAKRIKVGDLYTPVTILESSSIEPYENVSKVDSKNLLETEIANYSKSVLKLNIRPIIHFILDKGKTNRAITVYLKESHEEYLIGENSKKLLIGLFTSRADISAKQRSELELKLIELLGKFNINNSTPTIDPMGQEEEKQECQQILLI